MTKTTASIGQTITFILTLLAALPYESPLGDLFPPRWKAYIFAASAIATVILKHLKDLQTQEKQP